MNALILLGSTCVGSFFFYLFGKWRGKHEMRCKAIGIMMNIIRKYKGSKDAELCGSIFKQFTDSLNIDIRRDD